MILSGIDGLGGGWGELGRSDVRADSEDLSVGEGMEQAGCSARVGIVLRDDGECG